MSGKSTVVKPKSKMDRRTLRTRNALGDALVELMQQKPFKNITVQQVLDRAEVGRSTFYDHYHDKDDLFLSDVDDFWKMMASHLSRNGEPSNRVAPVRELFAHVAEAKEFRVALMASGKMHDVMELGIGNFARGIGDRLVQDRAARPMPSGQRQAVAHALAGALFSMLMWWIDRGMPASPAEMDEIYHRLAWSGTHVSAYLSAAKPAQSSTR